MNLFKISSVNHTVLHFIILILLFHFRYYWRLCFPPLEKVPDLTSVERTSQFIDFCISKGKFSTSLHCSALWAWFSDPVFCIAHDSVFYVLSSNKQITVRSLSIKPRCWRRTGFSKIGHFSSHNKNQIAHKALNIYTMPFTHKKLSTMNTLLTGHEMICVSMSEHCWPVMI